jgi:hypothetical protein
MKGAVGGSPSPTPLRPGKAKSENQAWPRDARNPIPRRRRRGRSSEGKLARSAREGVQAWVDPEGYRQWLIAQRENFEATVNRELGVLPKPK